MAHSLHQRPRPHRPDDPGHVPARRAVRRARRRADVHLRSPAARASRSSSASPASASPGSSGTTPTRWRMQGDAGPRGHARGGARAARHDRPALRAGRHAQAAGRRSPTPTCPNAFATGRSPEPLGGLRDHRHPATSSTAEELEGVLAHELSHVAHRDVLVMTLARRPASSPAWSPAARSTARLRRRRPAQQRQQRRLAGLADRAGGQPGRLRDQLLPDSGCSRATASCAPTGRAPT